MTMSRNANANDQAAMLSNGLQVDVSNFWDCKKMIADLDKFSVEDLVKIEREAKERSAKLKFANQIRKEDIKVRMGRLSENKQAYQLLQNMLSLEKMARKLQVIC
jgi:hypothetical protein